MTSQIRQYFVKIVVWQVLAFVLVLPVITPNPNELILFVANLVISSYAPAIGLVFSITWGLPAFLGFVVGSIVFYYNRLMLLKGITQLLAAVEHYTNMAKMLEEITGDILANQQAKTKKEDKKKETGDTRPSPYI